MSENDTPVPKRHKKRVGGKPTPKKSYKDASLFALIAINRWPVTQVARQAEAMSKLLVSDLGVHRVPK